MKSKCYNKNDMEDVHFWWWRCREGALRREILDHPEFRISNSVYDTSGDGHPPPVLGNKWPKKHIFLAWLAETCNP